MTPLPDAYFETAVYAAVRRAPADSWLRQVWADHLRDHHAPADEAAATAAAEFVMAATDPAAADDAIRAAALAHAWALLPPPGPREAWEVSAVGLGEVTVSLVRYGRSTRVDVRFADGLPRHVVGRARDLGLPGAAGAAGFFVRRYPLVTVLPFEATPVVSYQAPPGGGPVYRVYRWYLAPDVPDWVSRLRLGHIPHRWWARIPLASDRYTTHWLTEAAAREALARAVAADLRGEPLPTFTAAATTEGVLDAGPDPQPFFDPLYGEPHAGFPDDHPGN